MTAVDGEIYDEAQGGGTGEHYVSLCVLNPTGIFFNAHVPYSAEPKPGHWNWPPREDLAKRIEALEADQSAEDRAELSAAGRRLSQG